MISAPIIIEHDGILVARDDLCPGGTKARFAHVLFDAADEVVYASPCEGGAQAALAWTARELGKRATIFVAKRATPHPRTLQAKDFGATIMQCTPGYLGVVRARAREYCSMRGARLAPFGFDIPQAIDAIADAALATDIWPDEVWCASGSGVLARGLAKAWPDADRHAVQVGHQLTPDEVAGATIHIYPAEFSQRARCAPPFPSDPHYDAKAWAECKAARRGPGRIVLFWNVLGAV